MNIRKILFVVSSLGVVALTTTSCSGSNLRHTISNVNKVYQADLDHNGQIDDYEKGLTWAEAYDELISEANSMEKLNDIADKLNIDPEEEKRTSLARYEILHEAEELAMSTGAVVPLYNYGDPYLLKPNVTGVSSMDLGFKFLDTLSYTNGATPKFVVSVGTKGESFDPAVNTDVSTTIATNQFLIGAKRYVRGEEEVDESGKGLGTYIAKLDDGICTVKKHLVYSEESHSNDDDDWIKFDECGDLMAELVGKDPEEQQKIRDAYEGTARYTLTLKDGAVWNDNSRITVDDFIYAWARASSGTYNGQPIGMWSNMFDMIRGYDAWTIIGQQPTIDFDTFSPDKSFSTSYEYEAKKFVNKIVQDSNHNWYTVDANYKANACKSLEQAIEKGYLSPISDIDKFLYEYSWKDNGNGCAGGMAGVMKNKDGKSFTVQLVNDCDYFESLLAFPAFMPVAKEKIIKRGGKKEHDAICSESTDWWLNKTKNAYLTNGPLQIDGPIVNVDSGGIKLKRADHATPGVLDPIDPNTGKQLKTVDSIEFKFIDKDSTIYDSYKSGTLQFTNQFPSSVIDALMKKPDWHVAPQIGLFFYDFNVNDNTFDIKKESDPFTGERNREKLRKVMSLLINRDDIANNVAKKGCTAANGFVSDGVIETCIPKWDPNADSPSGAKGAYIADYEMVGDEKQYKTANWHSRNKDMSEYWNDGTYKKHYMDKRNEQTGGFFRTAFEDGITEEEVMKRNAKDAIRLAQEAGIKYNKKTGQFVNFPRISLVTNNGTALEDIAERMQAYYSLWGIDVTIATQEWQSFLATRRIGDFAFARQGWVADYSDPRTYLDLCTATSGNNDTQLGKKNWHSSH